MTSDLKQARCESCEGIGQTLTPEQLKNLMPQLSQHWILNDNSTLITRSFSFNNFYETMAFMNAVAWIANQENHHPDVELGYNYCHLSFQTHALKGLTHNDLICAAKVDALID